MPTESGHHPTESPPISGHRQPPTSLASTRKLRLHVYTYTFHRARRPPPAPSAAFWSRAFCRRMVARGSGAIVNVQSPASLQPFSGATAYCTGRWALRGLSEALACDTFGTGVIVQEVVCGEVTNSGEFECTLRASAGGVNTPTAPDTTNRSPPSFSPLSRTHTWHSAARRTCM